MLTFMRETTVFRDNTFKCPSKTFGARGLEEFLKVFFLLNFFLWLGQPKADWNEDHHKSLGTSWMELASSLISMFFLFLT